MEVNSEFSELEEYLVITVPSSSYVQQSEILNSESIRGTVEEAAPAFDYVSWTSNQTKILIDLYKEYKPRIGTLQIRNLKKMWEVIAASINEMLKIKVSPSNCENKWRVLDRGYKKYVDNKKKTGRGKKFFEFSEEMDALFMKKKNIHPEILLTSETVNHLLQVAQAETSQSEVIRSETPEGLQLATETPEISEVTPSKRNRCSILNRNKILENMRKDRLEYQRERLKIEREKLELKKETLEGLKKRNKLIEERNNILKKSVI